METKKEPNKGAIAGAVVLALFVLGLFVDACDPTPQIEKDYPISAQECHADWTDLTASEQRVVASDEADFVKTCIMAKALGDIE